MRDFRREAAELSEFVMHTAATTRGLVGFDYIARPTAPSRYDELQRAVERSLHTGQPLPVSSEHCESVIYSQPLVNVALRYWHDVSHVLRGLDFTPPQELRLAELHLGVLAGAGYGPETVVWRLLHADLVGQVYLSAVGGRFPLDQALFVRRALDEGLEAAVLAELGDELGERRAGLRLPAARAA